MDESTVKNYLISITERALQDACRPEQLSLFTNKIAAMPGDPDSMRRTIAKIKMAVRLLISEELADDLYEEMMSILNTET